MRHWATPAAVLLTLILAALACSVAISTAHFEDPTFYKDSTFKERTRTYKPDETFYCAMKLVDADDGSEVRAVWIALPGEDSDSDAETVVDETTTEADNGLLAFATSPPESGWTRGAYRLDLYLNGEKKTSVTFSVK
jgi:hypothetical protein